jgi:hypothetical protein
VKQETAVAFLKALGNHEVDPSGVWVRAPCPLAFALHQSGKDTNPSFAINIDTGNFNCFTCKSGKLTKLLQLIAHHLKTRPEYAPKFQLPLARKILTEADAELEPLPPYAEFPVNDKPFTPWPEDWLDKYHLAITHPRALWYLEHGRVEQGKGQAVPILMATAMELRYDATYDRIVCPYRHFNTKLAGARGRAIDPDAKMKHWDYTWQDVNNAHCVWYNEQTLELAVVAKAPVVVCEGQFDVMSVLRVYPYVVGNLTAKATIEKMVKLQNTYGVVTMLDNDETGLAATARYQEHLVGKVDFGSVDYPSEFKDPAQIPLDVLKEVLKDIL